MKNVNEKLSNRLSMVALVSLIFVAAMAAMAVPTVKAQPPPMLFVDPPYQKVTVCTTFAVNINFSVALPVNAVDFNLTFDPNLMECTDATGGSFPGNLDILSIEIQDGWVHVFIFKDSGFAGSGTIAEIEFHCKDVGTSFLNFSKAWVGLMGDGGSMPFPPEYLFNGTVDQIETPVGGEVLAIDSLALLIPWIAAAGAVAVATVLVLAGRRTFNH